MKNSIISKLFLCLLMTSPLLLASDVDMRADSDTEHVASSGGSGSGSGHYAAGAGGAGAGTPGFGLVDPAVAVGLDISGEKDDSCSVDALIVEALGGGSGSGSYAARNHDFEFDFDELGDDHGEVFGAYDCFSDKAILQRNAEMRKRLLQFGTGSFAANHIVKTFFLGLYSKMLGAVGELYAQVPKSMGVFGYYENGLYLASNNLIVANYHWFGGGFYQHGIDILDYETRKVVFQLPKRGNQKCICTLPENKFVVATTGVVEVWNIDTKSCERVMPVDRLIGAPTIINYGFFDKGYLMLWGRSHFESKAVTIYRFDLEQGKLVSQQSVPARCVEFFDDGTFAVVDYDANINCYAFEKDHTVSHTHILGNLKEVFSADLNIVRDCERALVSCKLKTFMNAEGVKSLAIAFASRCVVFHDVHNPINHTKFISDFCRYTAIGVLPNGKFVFGTAGGRIFILDQTDGLSSDLKFRDVKLKKNSEVTGICGLPSGDLACTFVKSKVWISYVSNLQDAMLNRNFKLDAAISATEYLSVEYERLLYMQEHAYPADKVKLQKQKVGKFVRGIIKGAKTTKKLLESYKQKLLDEYADQGVGKEAEAAPMRKPGKNKKGKGKGKAKARSNKRRRK